MRRRPRLWFRLNLRGVTWSVWFATLPEREQGECQYAKAKIVLSWDLSPEVVQSVLWHEMGHANADASGADLILGQALQKAKRKQLARYEEGYLRTLNHAMYETALQEGWLRLPPVPTWFSSESSSSQTAIGPTTTSEHGNSYSLPQDRSDPTT